MARMIVLEAKSSGEQFRLIGGVIKSDMELTTDERVKKIQQRMDEVLLKIGDFMKENPEDEIVVRKTGFAD